MLRTKKVTKVKTKIKFRSFTVKVSVNGQKLFLLIIIKGIVIVSIVVGVICSRHHAIIMYNPLLFSGKMSF